MSDGFTSRHGKYTEVVAEELRRSTPSEQQPAANPGQNVQRKKSTSRRKLPRIRLSKKVWLVVVGCVAIALIAAWLSADSVKRDYERQAAAMNRSIADAGKQSPSDSATAVSVADTLLQALNAPSTCRVAGVDVVSWYGPAKTARQNCQAVAERYNRLKKAIADMKSIATYSGAVESAIAPPLAQPPDGNFAVIGEYASMWTKAHEDIGRIPTPSGSLASIHTALVSKTAAIKDAWVKLDTANTTRDKAGFQAAEAELGKAYEDIRTIATQLQAAIQQQQTIITQANATPL